MSALQPKLLRQPGFWLLVLGSALAAIYMALLDSAGDTAHLGMSGLFWLATGSCLWDRRHDLKIDSNLLSRVLGIVLIAFVLWQSYGLLHQVQANQINFASLRVLPFLIGLGIALLAVRVAKLQIYWRELLILLFMGGPSIVAYFATDISPITARASVLLLWYTGFDVALHDNVFIILPTGSVEVYRGCSGIESITYVLGLAVLCLIMFPIAKRKIWFVPLVGMAIGFVINAIRVALMAVLVAQQNKAAFDYWHEGDGSLIFGLLAVLVFGAFYIYLLQHDRKARSLSSEMPGKSEFG